MNGNYYASFFVYSDSGTIGFQYDGPVALNEQVFSSTMARGAPLLARLVAQTLEVPESQVHVLEWEPLH
jgi:hypothetical protein